MKNVTLSMPENLLEKARQYAKENGTTLNELIRTQLKKVVGDSESADFTSKLKSFQDKISVDTRIKTDRDSHYL